MNSTLKLAGIASAALLVACGGGGSAPTTAAPAAPPTAGVSTLVATVPSASYTGEFSKAFELLNAERGRCGFGLLAQSSALDAAAMAHANYLKANAIVSHTEVQGQPGFTGASPSDRAKAKGYDGFASEVIASGLGEPAIRGLLSAPYHLNGLMGNYRDVGFGILESSVPNYPYFVANPGYQSAAGPQLLGGADIVTYPCDGTTGVNFQLRAESPNPVPGRDLSNNPIGTPVLFRVRDGQALAITNVSMVKTSSGAPVALRPVISAANDPNKGYFLVNEAYVAPDAPLERLTRYTVTYSGTNNGSIFTNRSFTFSTGNGVN